MFLRPCDWIIWSRMDVLRVITRSISLMAGVALVAAPSVLHADWRKDLLKERGIGLDEASLKKAVQQGEIGNQALEKAFGQLACDEFKDREQGQFLLSEAGEAVLDFLDSKEPIEDPEVRVRVSEIRKAVSSGAKTRMGPILRHAAKSLLENPKDAATSGLFYEWFGADKLNCFEGYRAFKHEGANTQQPFVKDGRLHIPGRHAKEQDQRLSLNVADWPGGKEMPERYVVSCLMGGEAGGAGAWHVAIGIGKVKALFHPGYNEGGFRFEQVGNLEKYSNNQDMGFTPEAGKLYRMDVTVGRFSAGRVGLSVIVTSDGGKTFETTIELNEDEIGPLDRISLERSGRRGGNAMFDDLRVKILK